MRTIYLLSTNASKLAAAKSVFSRYQIEVRLLELDIDEIQASNSQDIARKAAFEAHKLTAKPVIREDHSFYIRELGIPGPFMAYMDKQVSVEQLCKIINTLKDRTGYFELAATFVDENGKNYDMCYRVDVEFAHKARGDSSHNWERLIKLPYDDRVFAEYPSSERSALWTKNYEKIAQLISKQL